MSPFKKGDPRASAAAKKSAAVRRGEANNGTAAKKYWAQFTPEQRSEIARQRAKKRIANWKKEGKSAAHNFTKGGMTPQEAGRLGGLRTQAAKGKRRLLSKAERSEIAKAGAARRRANRLAELSGADQQRIIRHAADRLSTGARARGDDLIAEFHVPAQSDARVLLERAQRAALEILNLVASLRTYVE